MPSVPLSPQDEAAIYSQLPDTANLFSLVMAIPPDLISMALPLFGGNHDSRFPVAAVCLHDAASVMQEALFAICEAMMRLLYYGERRTPTDRHSAVFYGRYFADDAALRIYAAGEHLANAILCIHDCDHSALAATSRNKLTSLQSQVGVFVARRFPNHPTTVAVQALNSSSDWQKAIAYRNKWVHDQPPRIADLGHRFKRAVRWQPSPDGKSHTMGIGGADKPELTVEELVAFVRGGVHAFVGAFELVVNWYVDQLRPLGITVEPSRCHSTISFTGDPNDPTKPPSTPNT
jgi:hypothetical protein